MHCVKLGGPKLCMNEFSNIFSICHTTYLRKVVWRIRIIINCYYIFWYLHISNINTRKPEILFKMQGWNFYSV